MSTNLYDASRQWASRPDDQRYWNLDEMAKSAQQVESRLKIARGNPRRLRFEADEANQELGIRTKDDRFFRLSSWGLQQICRDRNVGAQLLSELPARLSAEILNERNNLAPDRDRVLQINADDPAVRTGVVRAQVSEIYTRFPNTKAIQWVQNIPGDWRNPPAWASPGSERTRIATAADVDGLPTLVKAGDLISPAGLYLSEEDLFIFLVSANHPIREPNGGILHRGFFLSNSEVGKLKVSLKMFTFRYACGNHIVWDVDECLEISYRHVGDNPSKFLEDAQPAIQGYLESSAQEQEEKIRIAASFKFGDNKEKVVAKVAPSFLSKKSAEAAYDSVLPDLDGDPRTAWGLAQGVTRMSQVETSAFRRTALDVAATQIIAAAAA